MISNVNQEKTLLIVWIYHEAVGHVVEAISAAAQFKSANPSLSISLLLNSKARADFVEFCPWISNLYRVHPEQDCDSQLAEEVPKEWDYIVYPQRLFYWEKRDYTPELLRANHSARSYFQANQWTQFQLDPAGGPKQLQFDPNANLRIELPAETRQWAHSFRKSDDLVISVLLGGAGHASNYPTLQTWNLIFNAIRKVYPKARFWITGFSAKRRHGWTSAKRYNQTRSKLVEESPDSLEFIDIGMERQLALIAESDVFLSPHTGFAFLAPCLGTPWLAVSGGRWAEDFFARVPFYCSVPRCPLYPCDGQMATSCRVLTKLRLPVKCMSCFQQKRLAKLVTAVGNLAHKQLSFNDAFSVYRNDCIEAGVDINKIYRIEEHFSRKELD